MTLPSKRRSRSLEKTKRLEIGRYEQTSEGLRVDFLIKGVTLHDLKTSGT